MCINWLSASVHCQLRLLVQLTDSLIPYLEVAVRCHELYYCPHRTFSILDSLTKPVSSTSIYTNTHLFINRNEI